MQVKQWKHYSQWHITFDSVPHKSDDHRYVQLQYAEINYKKIQLSYKIWFWNYYFFFNHNNHNSIRGFHPLTNIQLWDILRSYHDSLIQSYWWMNIDYLVMVNACDCSVDSETQVKSLLQKDATLLLMHWSYMSFALSHQIYLHLVMHMIHTEYIPVHYQPNLLCSSSNINHTEQFLANIVPANCRHWGPHPPCTQWPWSQWGHYLPHHQITQTHCRQDLIHKSAKT